MHLCQAKHGHVETGLRDCVGVRFRKSSKGENPSVLSSHNRQHCLSQACGCLFICLFKCGEFNVEEELRQFNFFLLIHCTLSS